jgi:hypothetical protein
LARILLDENKLRISFFYLQIMLLTHPRGFIETKSKLTLGVFFYRHCRYQSATFMAHSNGRDIMESCMRTHYELQAGSPEGRWHVMATFATKQYAIDEKERCEKPSPIDTLIGGTPATYRIVKVESVCTIVG